MRPVTPRGFRDVLPSEAAERESLVGRLGDAFSAWGYGRVETPMVERADALESASGSLDNMAFRFVDLDGHLLALRPDLTLPIARLVASRLQTSPGPHRLRYAADVFREHESLRGQSRQFTQVGVELVGADGPMADAEVVSVLVEGLRATGLGDFAVAVGTVAVLSAVVEAAEMPQAWASDVFSAAHARNIVALERLASAEGVAPAAAEALRRVPRIRGGLESIQECREAVSGCDCGDVLDGLEDMWRLLEAAGAAENVVLDFSVMRSFDYYTGLVIEAYAPGVGLPIAGGGRYDGVLERFGAPMPAVGFAIGLERLSIALVEHGVGVEVRGLDAVLGGDPAEALSASAALRRAGWSVALSSRTGLELVREADRLGAVEALIAVGGRIVRLDRDGGQALPLGEPIPYAPTTSWAERGEGQ